MTAGGGCFKCGSTDHIAKDCTGDATMKQSTKYILKDNNSQRGGHNARSVLLIAYVSVFYCLCDYVCPNKDYNFMV
jgi:hypothetical protein